MPEIGQLEQPCGTRRGTQGNSVLLYDTDLEFRKAVAGPLHINCLAGWLRRSRLKVVVLEHAENLTNERAFSKTKPVGESLLCCTGMWQRDSNLIPIREGVTNLSRWNRPFSSASHLASVQCSTVQRSTFNVDAVGHSHLTVPLCFASHSILSFS
jgi:hypothetical protein